MKTVQSVGIVCFNKEDPNKVLLVKHSEGARQKTGIYWLLPNIEKAVKLAKEAL